MPTKILLIEHNPDHTLLTKRILKKTNKSYHVDSTDQPQEGLRKIIEENYDLIISDYRMPGLSALDILKNMKGKGKDLPFIVVTASGNERAAVDLMREGAYDYVLRDLSYEDSLPIVIERSVERYHGIVERRKSEETLRESKEFVENLIVSLRDGFSLLDRQGVHINVNPALCQMIGFSKEELIGIGMPHPYWPPEMYEEIEKAFQKALWGEFDNFELTFMRKNGERFPAIVSPFWVRDKQGNVIGYFATVKDITEHKKSEKELESAYQKLKEAQQQLIQSGKMAAVGQLAAEISHELNQPLTGIKGFAQAALRELNKNNPLRKDLKRIEEQADRMDEIIKNIHFFARKSEFKMQDLDINKPIEDSLMLLTQQLRVHNIRLRTSLDKDLPKIKGDFNQLQQAFLNLITNARDAIDSLKSPDGGELLVRTSLSEDKKKIEATFKDTGCGIPKENLEHIFNPFFTTKSLEGGIGLGLAIVYRIVEDHKGRIEVESRAGKGATLKIILPVLATDSV